MLRSIFVEAKRNTILSLHGSLDERLTPEAIGILVG